MWLPIFLALEAEAHAKAGHSDTALQVIAEALLISEETGERWAIAEVLRIKAGLLLATGRPTEEVEALLVNSLQIARHQQARSWELRTACDLARLWQHQGRGAEALQLVQTIYDQFTEGFDTADLRDAEALLAELESAVAGLRPVDQAYAVVLGNQRYGALSFTSSRPRLTNTGTRAGADVSQLYLTEAGVDKRMRLVGFERLEANLAA